MLTGSPLVESHRSRTDSVHESDKAAAVGPRPQVPVGGRQERRHRGIRKTLRRPKLDDSVFIHVRQLIPRADPCTTVSVSHHRSDRCSTEPFAVGHDLDPVAANQRQSLVGTDPQGPVGLVAARLNTASPGIPSTDVRVVKTPLR